METKSSLISPIRRQLLILESVFGLDTYPIQEKIGNIPQSSFGDLVAIPKRNILAKKFFPEISDEGLLKNKLTDLVIKEIDKKNFCISYINSFEKFFLERRTNDSILKMEELQSGEIILMNVQIFRQNGRSSDNLFDLKLSEFPLDPFYLSCILMTNESLISKDRNGIKLVSSGGYLVKSGIKEVPLFEFRLIQNKEIQISNYSVKSDFADEEFYHPIGITSNFVL